MPSPSESLRIAWLVYRGNPHCGGQGVYTRYLARELTELGHQVTVFSGQPYPELDDPAQLAPVPEPRPLPPGEPVPGAVAVGVQDHRSTSRSSPSCARRASPSRTRSASRARRLLDARRADFDLIHDNQCLGSGLLGMMDDGWPVLATLHHPITVDRDLDLDARHERVAALHPAALVRVPRDADAGGAARSRASSPCRSRAKRDIVAADGRARRPAAHRARRRRPRRSSARCPTIARVPGRLMTTASADVPMKGLVPLLEALAKVRTERDDAELVIIGKPKGKSKIPALIERLGLTDAVRFVSGVTTERIVELYAEAEVAVVPSLYEGFSLPAVEAMACGVPLVATTGGALPEVVGTDGETGLLVPPGDPDALALALLRALGDADLRARIGEAGRARVARQVHVAGRPRSGRSRTTGRCSTPERAQRRRAGRLMLTVDFDRLDLRAGQPAARHGLRRRAPRVRGDAARRDRRRARLRRRRAQRGARHAWAR